MKNETFILHQELKTKADFEWTLKKLRSEAHELIDAINDFLNASMHVDVAVHEENKVIEESADVKVLIERLGFYNKYPCKYLKDIEKIGIEKMQRALTRIENERSI